MDTNTGKEVPMLLSVSRRTDIPSCNSEWFYNRIKAGFVCVRNPMNYRQVSEVRLTPDLIDCIIFWTKNPTPMMERLDELKDYAYYFQFTLTGYGRDVERNLPDKRMVLIPAFQNLSDRIGRERVIWRYDPIFFSDRYTREYHLNAFRCIAEALRGYTEKCVISFVDIYPKNRKNMERLSYRVPDEREIRKFAKELNEIAGRNGIAVASCAEKMDLEDCGIVHNRCIDRELIERITGRRLNVNRDKNQRAECGCAASVDIGTYNTCGNGCVYCYANHSASSVESNLLKYDPASPILCGQIEEKDVIKVKDVRLPYA